ncbi:hypothetical protein ACTG9Q_24395 [Actinokineospora sp. 24-640]
MDATLHTAAGHCVLRLQLHLPQPPETAWNTLNLDHWLPPAPDLTITTPTDTLRFHLTPTSTGSLLVFTHTFDDRPAAATHATHWHHRLATAAGIPTPDPTTLHEHYTARFDLLRGTAEPDGPTWRVHFDRHLTATPTDIWPHLHTLGPAHTEHHPTHRHLHTDHGGEAHLHLTPGPASTHLTLDHHGVPTDHVAATLAHWHTAIRALAATVMGPTPGAPDADLEDHYRRTIGATIP